MLGVMFIINLCAILITVIHIENENTVFNLVLPSRVLPSMKSEVVKKVA